MLQHHLYQHHQYGSSDLNYSMPLAAEEDISQEPPVGPLAFPTPRIHSAEFISIVLADHSTPGRTVRVKAVVPARSSNSLNSSIRGSSTVTTAPPSSSNSSTGSASSSSSTEKAALPEIAAVPSLLNATIGCNKSAFLGSSGRAYLIKKKLTRCKFGSIRLCMVLRRLTDHERAMFAASPPSAAAPTELLESQSFVSGTTATSSRSNSPTTSTLPQAEWISTDELVVVKVTSWSKISRHPDITGKTFDPIKEVAAMQHAGGMHNPYILGCIEALQDEERLYIVMPYCAGGDLYSRSRSCTHFQEAQARTWFRQLIQGLLHLQKKGICHRGIALENVLLTEKNNLVISGFSIALRVPYSDITNFGAVCDASEGVQRRLIKEQDLCGSLTYLAPEIISRRPAFDGFAVDLWSAGCILFILLAGMAPFRIAHLSDSGFERISRGELRDLILEAGIILSDKACDLLQRMLHAEPSRRLTLAQIMNHPWVLERNNATTNACPTSIPTSFLNNNTQIREDSDELTVNSQTSHQNNKSTGPNSSQRRLSLSRFARRESMDVSEHSKSSRISKNSSNSHHRRSCSSPNPSVPSSPTPASSKVSVTFASPCFVELGPSPSWSTHSTSAESQIKGSGAAPTPTLPHQQQPKSKGPRRHRRFLSEGSTWIPSSLMASISSSNNNNNNNSANNNNNNRSTNNSSNHNHTNSSSFLGGSAHLFLLTPDKKKKQQEAAKQNYEQQQVKPRGRHHKRHGSNNSWGSNGSLQNFLLRLRGRSSSRDAVDADLAAAALQTTVSATALFAPTSSTIAESPAEAFVPPPPLLRPSMMAAATSQE